MKKSSLFFVFIILASVVFAAKAATFPDLHSPNIICVDADKQQFFITEGIYIYIYSLKDYSLQKKIGKRGEGPREFRGNVYIYVHPDSIIVNSSRKLSYFTREGEYKKEVRVPNGFWYEPLGKGFVGYCNIQDGKTIYNSIQFFDQDFHKIKEINRQKLWLQQVKDTNLITMRTSRFYIQKNKIITAGDDGKIYLHDTTGNLIRTISHKYKEVEVTKDDMKEYRDYIKRDHDYKLIYEAIKSRISFPTYYPPIRHFTVADNTIYILTYNKNGDKSEFVLFDTRGKFLKNLMLPLIEKDIMEFYPYTIKNGKLFQLVEDKDEVWNLHIYEIES